MSNQVKGIERRSSGVLGNVLYHFWKRDGRRETYNLTQLAVYKLKVDLFIENIDLTHIKIRKK